MTHELYQVKMGMQGAFQYARQLDMFGCRQNMWILHWIIAWSSEEVSTPLVVVVGLLDIVIWDGGEDLEGGLEVLVDLHDGGDVAAAVAVVGRGPDGDDILLGEVVLEALHYELVGAGNKAEAIDVVELAGDLAAKQPAGATWRDLPGVDVVGIAPEQVGEAALVGDLLGAGQDSYLVQHADFR